MRKPKKKQAQPKDVAVSPISQMMVQDAFQNVMARTGFNTINLMEGTEYPLTRLTRNYNLMTSLFRNNWLAQKVISIVSKDILKNWIKFTTDIPPEDIDKINRAMRIAKVRSGLLDALNWGRLYGGAAALMLIEGQEDILDQPLDINSIMPGDFKGLMVVDRWSGVYPQLQLVDDISSPDFGLPAYYDFRDKTSGIAQSVHHSRILRFIGHDLPQWEQQAEAYWGSSIIEPLYEELKKRDNTSANIAMLIFQSRLRVLKIKDLNVLISGANKEALKDFYNTIQAQNWLQSNQGIQVIGADDDFQSIDYTYTGLNEIYSSFMMDVAGASGIPVTKLFGRSPAGMNATGEFDMMNYYDMIEQEQESHLRPQLEKLLPVVCMSTLGLVPDDLGFDFNPIGTPTEEQVANIVERKTEAILSALDRGVISQQTALKELKQSGEGTGMWTNITDEEINKANDEPTGDLLFEGDDPEKELATEERDEG